MAIEKTFVKEGIRESQVENFLRKRFERAGYSRTEIQRTPVGTRIIVYAHKPGLVIGRSGRRVNEITEEIKNEFGFENPLIDVREVREPMLDANIVASRIADALERGIHFKRVCNFYIDKVMDAGAVGILIKVAGKLAGAERSRFQKFREGFIAHSGEYAERLVDKGFAEAMLKPGLVGVQVSIMREMPNEVTRKAEEEKVPEEIEVKEELKAAEPPVKEEVEKKPEEAPTGKIKEKEAKPEAEKKVRKKARKKPAKKTKKRAGDDKEKQKD